MFSQKNEGNKLTLLKEAVKNLTSILSEEELLKRATSFIEESTGAEKAVFCLADEKGSTGELKFGDPDFFTNKEAKERVKSALSAEKIVTGSFNQELKDGTLKTISQSSIVSLPL